MANLSIESEFVEDEVKKRLHEEFVRNLNGTTIEETFLIMYSLPLWCFVSLVCVSFLFPNLLHHEKFSLAPLRKVVFLYVIEMVIIILPLILTFTILSGYLYLTLLICLFICVYLVVIHIAVPEGGSLYWSKPNLNDILSVSIKGHRRSYITNFRSLIYVITAFCILAVDFNIFPRRFAKTEIFGYGIMDLGVGLFIVANSIVLKSQITNRKNLNHTIYGTSVLFLLGLIRYFTIKYFNYQTHVTEYGVHWNFFFSLGLIQLISRVILFSDLLFKKCHLISVFLIALHQLALFYGLQDWVLNESRNSLVEANKEGIVSLFGYVGLYLVGVSISNFVITVRPTIKSEVKLLGKLIICTILFYSGTLYLDTIFPASRRLVNITYITWITGVTFLGLSLTSLVEILSKCLIRNASINESDYYVPVIFQSISYNGLLYFLLANIFTGVVNIVFMTISMNILNSLFVLVGYMIVLGGITEILYYFKLNMRI